MPINIGSVKVTRVRPPTKKDVVVTGKAARSEIVPTNRGILAHKEKMTVCGMLAAFISPTEISVYIKKTFKKELTPQSINHYATDTRWKPTIERLRAEYAENISHIPIYHKRKRLERLEEQYQSADTEDARSTDARRKKRTECRSILKEAREETIPSRISMGDTNILAIQFQNLPEEELLRKKEELLTKIKSIGGITDAETRRKDAGRGLPAIEVGSTG